MMLDSSRENQTQGVYSGYPTIGIVSRIELLECFFTQLLKFPIPAGNIYGLFAFVRWKKATFKGKCRNIFPTRSIWVWIDAHTEILESVLLIYTIATFGVLSA